MPAPHLHNAEKIRAACLAGQAAMALAFSRALDTTLGLEIGPASPWQPADAPSEWNGPGLVFLFTDGPGGALAVLPDASGIAPAWCAQPDEAGGAKLQALATELGALLFPDAVPPTQCLVGRVPDLTAAIDRARLPDDSTRLAVHLAGNGKSGTLTILWPAGALDQVLGHSAPSATDATIASSPAPTRSAAPPRPPVSSATAQPPPTDIDTGLRLLPSYTRSLLRISVPVTVTLAEAKQPLSSILDIGPGSIIHFNKPCEETLTLEVAGQKFAVGEAVKVGDKFGLWLTAMILPEERFWVLGKHHPPARAK